jgi:hypothetical protein
MKKILVQICKYLLRLGAGNTTQYRHLTARVLSAYPTADAAAALNSLVALAGYNGANISHRYSSSQGINAFAPMHYRCFTSCQPNNVSKLIAIEKITFWMLKTQKVKQFGIARASKATA